MGCPFRKPIGRFSPISTMEAAENGSGRKPSMRLDFARKRRVLAESEVRSVAVVIVGVCGEHAPQMSLVPVTWRN